MRNHDLSPLYRSTIGFDRLIGALLDQPARTEWPPHDVLKTGQDEYRVTLALAGYGPDDVTVTQHGTTLAIAGKAPGAVGADAKAAEFLHRGIARRSFDLRLTLAEHVTVSGAEFDNGLLHVDLVRRVPEALRPRRIAIGSAKAVAPAQDNAPAADAQAA